LENTKKDWLTHYGKPVLSTQDTGNDPPTRTKTMSIKITIQAVDADFTPKGKRTARCVQTSRGGRQLRWYVGGRLFRHLSLTQANIDLTRQWGAAG
jgi:hypothetical protein